MCNSHNTLQSPRKHKHSLDQTQPHTDRHIDACADTDGTADSYGCNCGCETPLRAKPASALQIAKRKKWRNRIIIALVLFVIIYAMELAGLFDVWFGHPLALYVEFTLFLIPYLIAGYDVLVNAARNIIKGHGLAEDFLMSVATIGAFALVFFPNTEPHFAEGAAVMLFFQVGELFQSYAVDRSRRSISALMEITPEYAQIMRDGVLIRVDPKSVLPGDNFIVKPGERIPLDGIVLNGESRLDTSALTGESVPRTVHDNDEVLSGCVNLSGVLTVQATKPYEDSTISRILELVENAADKKARTESFITRFARVYTPLVVGAALLIALIPPLFLGDWSNWILRGLTFLVVSCPCALVISVPLSFFGGIGGASKLGILIKGSNYLEALSKVDTIVFDKTGTLTSGTFSVVDVLNADDITRSEILDLAAHAEAGSNHPIALSILDTFTQNGGVINHDRIGAVEEISGRGIKTEVDGEIVLIGNDKLMYLHDIAYEVGEFAGTVLHVSTGSRYLGTIVVGDTIKADARDAIDALHVAGIDRVVMLTGDRFDVAAKVASALNIDEFHAEMLPQNKVEELETIMASRATPTNGRNNVAFVGDGINDAPVLMRADVGIAMGALGSDAAIEAADVVLMDDKPTRIAQAIQVARKTMYIVWQNIIFALGIKFAVLILAAFGIANMWMAVFADVGVCVIAILNAMRAMKVSN